MKRNHFAFAAMASLMILFTACASDDPAVTETEITSGTTVSEFTGLPYGNTVTSVSEASGTEMLTAAAEGTSAETEMTTVDVSEDDEAAVQTSAGKLPEIIETVEIHTSYTEAPELTKETAASEETTVQTPDETKNSGNDEEASGFSARIISVSDNSITVEVLSEKWIGIFGSSFVKINTKWLENVHECAAGDHAEIITDEVIGISDEYIPPILDEGVAEIRITERAAIGLGENSVLAKVLSCDQVTNGEYFAIVVQAFNMEGYGFETEISMRSDTKFSAGDWVKIDFAEDTAFMESYPMQVLHEYILGIEKV